LTEINRNINYEQNSIFLRNLQTIDGLVIIYNLSKIVENVGYKQNCRFLSKFATNRRLSNNLVIWSKFSRIKWNTNNDQNSINKKYIFNQRLIKYKWRNIKS